MRTVRALLGNKEITLNVTFGAAAKISETVEDPLEITRQAGLEDAMMRAGMPYDPAFKFTVPNVAQILHAGVDDMTLEQVQDLVISGGALEAQKVAIDFIAAIATPKTQETPKSKKDEAPPEKK